MSLEEAGLPRVITEPLGGGALARAAVSGAPLPFYAARPVSAAGWAERVDAVRRRTDAAWLDALRPAFGDSLGMSVAGARIDRSAAGRGVVVTTGQQPGLFGGPVYTWSKALSALTLADEIERATGVPTAPVFWAATDDADFAEASVTRVATADGVTTLRLAPTVAEGTPMAHVPLGGDVQAAYDALVRAGGSAAFVRAWEVAREAYLAPGRTVGSAYVALLRAVLQPLGVAVLDASHPATRVAMDPLLRDALRRAAEVEHALEDRATAVERGGFRVQVPAVSGLSLVFASGARGEKQRVRVADAGRAAAAAPEGSLGPNVLLRPVAEAAILPTVAYVAGPGELAYFAQVSAVAEALGVATPLAVPRWSCTLLEPGVSRLLARRRLAPTDLADPHAAEGRLARETLPVEIASTLAELRGAVAGAAERLARAEGAGRDGSAPPLLPAPAIEGARRSIEVRLDRLERRYLAAAKRTAAEGMRDLVAARASLYPDGLRQERALNFLPFLARYGPALLDAMRTSAARHASALVEPGRVDMATDATRAAAPSAVTR